MKREPSKDRPHKSQKHSPKCVQRIRANRSRQVQTNSYSPLEYYEDQRLKCRDCRAEFVFTALEQLAWYEEYGIPHYATRVRCQHCSKKHTANELLKSEYDSAIQLAKSKTAGHKELLLASMLAIVCSEAGLQSFDSARNIGWLRKCMRLRPNQKDTVYFLGRSYDLGGNVSRAIEHYQAFCEKAGETKQRDLKIWLRIAEKRLRELTNS